MKRKITVTGNFMMREYHLLLLFSNFLQNHYTLVLKYYESYCISKYVFTNVTSRLSKETVQGKWSLQFNFEQFPKPTTCGRISLRGLFSLVLSFYLLVDERGSENEKLVSFSIRSVELFR